VVRISGRGDRATRYFARGYTGNIRKKEGNSFGNRGVVASTGV